MYNLSVILEKDGIKVFGVKKEWYPSSQTNFDRKFVATTKNVLFVICSVHDVKQI